MAYIPKLTRGSHKNLINTKVVRKFQEQDKIHNTVFPSYTAHPTQKTILVLKLPQYYHYSNQRKVPLAHICFISTQSILISDGVESQRRAEVCQTVDGWRGMRKRDEGEGRGREMTERERESRNGRQILRDSTMHFYRHKTIGGGMNTKGI